ncbi:uncharacterized protein SPAPADRAFT_60731, partial [Spathaspora passalidarum NRRL Y-27907]
MDHTAQDQSIQDPQPSGSTNENTYDDVQNTSRDTLIHLPADTPPSSSPSSPCEDRDQLIFTPPRSPYLRSSDRMNITPDSPTDSPRLDEFVMYSDSDVASQSSLDLGTTPKATRRKLVKVSSDEEEYDEEEIADRVRYYDEQGRGVTLEPPSEKPRRRKRSSVGRKKTVQTESTNNPKSSKKKIRRQSRSKEPSERSRSDFIPGTGYTSVPATGKVFRNLLILEESLREQVIQQRAMRRKYLTFLALLCSIIASLIHHLFILDPSVSSTGTTRVILQFLLLASIITLILYHLSGEYQKTIVLPRKFLSSTNKGLRQLNVRLVKIKTPL